MVESGRSLVRFGPYWRWSVATQLGRVPGAMAPLAFTVLTTATTGSYRAGAVMMTAFVAGEVVTAVPTGRLLDRVGPARGTRLLLLLSGAASVLLLLAARADLPGAGLLAVTAVAGAVAGGIMAGLRSMLAGTVPPDLLVRAVGVDTILAEGVIIGGPALTVALSAWSSAAPLVGMVLAYLISMLAYQPPPPTFMGRVAGMCACASVTRSCRSL